MADEFVKKETRSSETDDISSPYRGGIHNVQMTTEENQDTVNPFLYQLLVEDEVTYDLPYDAPMYAKIMLFEPDETDIEDSQAGNP